MAATSSRSMVTAAVAVAVAVAFLIGGTPAEARNEGKQDIGYYELRRGEFSIVVTNWGATILSVNLPDKNGRIDDVVLGYKNIGSYVNDTTYFGALVGRVANRIAGGRFTVKGQAYHTYKNDGNNTLHGGHRGFNQVFWSVRERVTGQFPYVTFYYRSYDGEQGFPGALDVLVTYKIDGDDSYSVTMYARPVDKPTPVNLAQHTYWNLRGHGRGTILDHSVQIFASAVTPVGAGLIPTGAVKPVSGTPFDFRAPAAAGARIASVPGGYDINYVLDGEADGQGVRKVAVVREATSGRVMELWSDQPGVQFYTGNFLKGEEGKGGARYVKHGGLCLETQDFPDAVHKPEFPTEIYRKGQVYKHYMLYKFSLSDKTS
ncbi:galactose mutarotase-like [Oryza brachyantha]|uniref:galactose mutarotase-like n=1 Tax=Oryza brachyantha TaxID=4533 RepID=UPI001ADC9602|nr:galactose mutarotase-like [Oryza brachyantha]